MSRKHVRFEGVVVCGYIRTHTYIYIVMSVYLHACIFTCMYVCLYVCMYVRKYLCMFVRKYVCMHACMYVFILVCLISGFLSTVAYAFFCLPPPGLCSSPALRERGAGRALRGSSYYTIPCYIRKLILYEIIFNFVILHCTELYSTTLVISY